MSYEQALPFIYLSSSYNWSTDQDILAATIFHENHAFNYGLYVKPK